MFRSPIGVGYMKQRIKTICKNRQEAGELTPTNKTPLSRQRKSTKQKPPNFEFTAARFLPAMKIKVDDTKVAGRTTGPASRKLTSSGQTPFETTSYQSKCVGRLSPAVARRRGRHAFLQKGWKTPHIKCMVVFL